MFDKGFMGIISSYLSLAIPVATAIIAGTVTLVVTILSKEQKTSEFRQAWIDSLRSDVAELAGRMETVVDMAESVAEDEDDDGSDFFNNTSQEMIKIQTCVVRIRLRLNPSEHEHILDPLKRLVDSDLDQSWSDMVSDLELVVSGSQVLLKSEWERVKKGEPAYIKLKQTSSRVIRIGFFLACLGITVWGIKNSIPYFPQILQLLSVQ